MPKTTSFSLPSDERQMQSWANLEFHRAFLADDIRNLAYKRALELAVQPGATVLDVGSGTGILSFLAARAGAERVLGSYGDTALNTPTKWWKQPSIAKPSAPPDGLYGPAQLNALSPKSSTFFRSRGFKIVDARHTRPGMTTERLKQWPLLGCGSDVCIL